VVGFFHLNFSEHSPGEQNFQKREHASEIIPLTVRRGVPSGLHMANVNLIHVNNSTWQSPDLICTI